MTDETKTKKTKVETLPQVYVGNEKMAIADTVHTQMRLLAIPTPKEYIKRRPGRGGKQYDYVEFNYIIGRLNATFMFDWDAEIVDHHIFRDENQISTKVRLTVRFADGKAVMKEAWGGSEIARFKTNAQSNAGQIINLADNLKSAEADALKKAASMLGICWDVYAGLVKSGKHKSDENPPEPPPPEEPGIDEYPQSDKEAEFRTIPITVNKKTVMHTKFEALNRFGKAKEELGEILYYKILGEYGYVKSNEIPPKDVPKVYYAMEAKWKEIKEQAKRSKVRNE